MKSLTPNKSVLEQENKYLDSIRVFPFLFHFSVEINKKSSIKEDTRKIKNCKAIKEDTRKMENCKANNIPEKCFFTEVAGNRVSDYYARNIYIKVSLEIAVPWILLTSKILYQNSKFVQKYRSRCPKVITIFTIKHAFPILVLL